MKKVAMTLAVAFIAISSIFCGAVQTSTSAKVSLTLTNDMFAVEKFGFVATDDTDTAWIENEDMEVLPQNPIDKFELQYDPNTNTAKNSNISVYYKVRGSEPLTIYIGATDALKCAGKDPINFDLRIKDTDESVNTSAATKSIQKGIKLSTSNIYEAKTIPLEIETTTELNATFVSDAAYKSSIQVKVVPAN